MQPVQHAPVDDQVLTGCPDRRAAGTLTCLQLAVLAAFLSDQTPEVAVRAGIASSPRGRQQPLGADLALRGVDLGRHERPDALVVLPTLDPLSGGVAVLLDDPLDGLVGDAAHLGGAAVGADLAVGADDVQLLPRWQQWSPLGGAVTG
jgi:hypothetical protein